MFLKKNNKGSVTIESVISLTVFLVLFSSIFSVINYAKTQMYMSSIVDDVAKEISYYSYLYSVTGLDKKSNELGEKAESIKTINKSYTKISAKLTGGEDKTIDSEEIKEIIAEISNGTNFDSVQQVLKEPSTIVAFFSEVMIDESKDLLADFLVKALSLKYIDSSSEKDIDLTLKKYGINEGIDSIDFSNSKFFLSSNPDEIYVSAIYEVEYPQLIKIPFKTTFRSSTKIKGWLGGDFNIE